MNSRLRHITGIHSRPHLIVLTLLLTLVTGCSVAEYVPEGETFYSGVGKITYSDEADVPETAMAKSDVSGVLSYKPNGALFGSSSMRLPFTYPFWFSKTFAGATDPLGKWLYKSFGSDPIFLSTVKPDLRAQVGEQVLAEYGFFGGTVVPRVDYSRDSVTAKVNYDVSMGRPHLLDSIAYYIPIVTPDSLVLDDPEERLLHRDDVFSVYRLERERSRIAGVLRDRGYFYFTPSAIHYEADTLAVPERVQLRVVLADDTPADALYPWHIGQITYDLYDLRRSELTDSTLYKGILFRYHKTPPVRLRFLASRVALESGRYYNERYQSSTVASLAELETFVYTNVSFAPRHPDDSLSLLDVNMVSMLDKPYSAELEATYRLKSNNQTGPGLALSVNRRNIFRGGETLSLRLQGNYEWQTGYGRSSAERPSWDVNSYLLQISTDLRFPRLLLPGLYYHHFTYPAHSKLGLSSTLLSRSGFYRQVQFAFDTEYRFEPYGGVRHTIRPLRISYNHLYRRTEAFDEALAANPGLSLSFRNQFIPQASYLFGFETRNPLSPHTFSLELYTAEAGNLLSLLSKDQRLGSGGAPFAKFVKGSLELRYAYRFSSRVALATRAYGGAIYSYGRQTVAPYTEQFYSGGANSLRGFNVRSLGPGAYTPLIDSPLAFLDRTGDLRLEGNMELRAKVVGDLELATFVDAGNIWLLRDDPRKPDGTISPKYFLRDVALSAGLGLRYDLSFLVVRLDLGVALHRPDRIHGAYFNTFGDKHNLPLALHLAVGYPF